MQVRDDIKLINDAIRNGTFFQELPYYFQQYSQKFSLKRVMKNGRIVSFNGKHQSIKEAAEGVSKSYANNVVFFVERLKEAKPAFNFSYLEENIGDLKITNKIFSKKNFFSSEAYGKYFPDLNKICLRVGYSNLSIYHELMHMASSIYADGKIFCGFYQYIPDKIDIGYGLNEGYTQLLTERYFYDCDVNKSYNVLVFIAKFLEKIIGREKMEECFFNADLSALCDEANKYFPDQDFKELIIYLDIIAERYKSIEEVRSETFKKSLNKVWEHLILAYVTEEKLRVYSSEISFEEYMGNLNRDILPVLYTGYSLKGYNVDFCNRERLNEILFKQGININFENVNKNVEVEKSSNSK